MRDIGRKRRTFVLVAFLSGFLGLVATLLPLARWWGALRNGAESSCGQENALGVPNHSAEVLDRDVSLFPLGVRCTYVGEGTIFYERGTALLVTGLLLIVLAIVVICVRSSTSERTTDDH